MTVDVIGWVAVVLTQVFYIPNTLKILRTRDVQGYSLAGWGMLFAGLGCYLIYFASRGDVVGVVANVCGMAGSGLTTVCIWRWRDRSGGAQPARAGREAVGEPADSGAPAA